MYPKILFIIMVVVLSVTADDTQETRRRCGFNEHPCNSDSGCWAGPRFYCCHFSVNKTIMATALQLELVCRYQLGKCIN